MHRKPRYAAGAELFRAAAGRLKPTAAIPGRNPLFWPIGRANRPAPWGWQVPELPHTSWCSFATSGRAILLQVTLHLVENVCRNQLASNIGIGLFYFLPPLLHDFRGRVMNLKAAFLHCGNGFGAFLSAMGADF